MRGNLGSGVIGGKSGRSIPAYAGELPAARRLTALRPVYPRVCGGTNLNDGLPFAGFRLSPRMRGNPIAGPIAHRREGSIPAYAGEPASRTNPTGASTVYPRVCGGTIGAVSKNSKQPRLSPRMRGNRRVPPRSIPRQSSIPAYAGEPIAATLETMMFAVYPRVCGGTTAYNGAGRITQRLSPRMRGNPRTPCACSATWASIPAYAGEPEQAVQRVRFDHRLSPRMRGNRYVAAIRRR